MVYQRFPTIARTGMRSRWHREVGLAGPSRGPFLLSSSPLLFRNKVLLVGEMMPAKP